MDAAIAGGMVFPPAPAPRGGETTGPSTGGGSAAPSAPATPGPRYNGPSTGGSSTPGKPAGPATGGGGGPKTGAPRTDARPSGPKTARDAGADTSTWETWWRFHRDTLVDARRVFAEHQRRWQLDGMTQAPEFGGRPLAGQVAAIAAPALRAVLAHETNPDLLCAALIALARIDGPTEGELAGWDADVDDLIAGFLAHPQGSVSEAATIALGIRARSPGAQRLQSLLVDDKTGRALIGRNSVPYRERAFAAYGLGLCAERTSSEDLRRWVVHALSHALSSDELNQADLQSACVAALGLAHLDSASALLEHADAGSPKLLKRGAALPASSSSVALVADLFAVLADEGRPTNVRAQVPTAIARAAEGTGEDLRAECVREMLARLTKPHEKSEVCAGLMIALGDLARAQDTPHDRAARAAVIAAARDGDHATQCFALVTAGRIGASAKQAEERDAAFEMESLLTEALEHGRSGTDGFAAMGLGLMRDAHGLLDPERGNSALRRTLRQSGSSSTQSAAAIALGLRHDESSRDALHDLLFTGGDDEVRGLYALALGLSGDCGATDTLRELVTRSAHHPALLRECVLSLGLLGDRDLTASLVKQMTSAPTQSAQTGYAQALASVGDSRCLGPLADLVGAQDTSLDARASAVRALGMVSDLDPLPWNTSYALDAQYLAASETLTTPSGGGILDPR